MATLFPQTVVNKALANPCWVTKIDANHYHVTPKTLVDVKSKREHGKYNVTVTIDKHGLPTIERCVDSRTGKQCKGFKFNSDACYHGACLSIHLVRPILRKEAA